MRMTVLHRAQAWRMHILIRGMRMTMACAVLVRMGLCLSHGSQVVVAEIWDFYAGGSSGEDGKLLKVGWGFVVGRGLPRLAYCEA